MNPQIDGYVLSLCLRVGLVHTLANYADAVLSLFDP